MSQTKQVEIYFSQDFTKQLNSSFQKSGVSVDFLKKSFFYQGIEISYENNIWDLSKLMQANEDTYKLNFKEVPTAYIDLMKMFAIDLLHDYRPPSRNAYIVLMNAKKFVVQFSKDGYNSLTLLTGPYYEKYIKKQQKHHTLRTCENYRYSIDKLLKFYTLLTKYKFDKKLLSRLQNNYAQQKRIKNEQIANKTGLLPQEFYNLLQAKLYKDIFDETIDSYTRKIYALIYISTQSGMRRNELSKLKKGCLEEKQIGNDMLYVIVHTNSKSKVKGKNPPVETVRKVVNKSVSDVIKYIERDDERGEYLTGQYIHPDKLALRLRMYCYKNKDELQINTFNSKKFEGMYKEIPVPIFRQFRVYVATQISRAGLNEIEVSKYLGHRDEKMLGYYIFPTAKIDEFKIVEELEKEILEDKIKVMGSRSNMYNQIIDDFLDKNKLNVSESIDDLITKFESRIAVRIKSGGACIKTASNRLCEHDANTNEFLCAYNICPNQCFFYFNLDYDWNVAQQCFKTHLHNKKEGFKRDSERELVKCQKILKDKVLPEIEQLRIELGKQGEEKILLKHPSLEFVINDLENIEKEAQKWLNTKTL